MIATGTPTARDLAIPGRELKGVYFALDMLAQQNRVLAGCEYTKDQLVSAKGKDVLVIAAATREATASARLTARDARA